MSERDQGAVSVPHRLAVLTSLHMDDGAEERFDRITRTARDAFGVAGAFLNLAGADVLTHKSQNSDQQFPGSTPIRDTFCGRTLHHDGAVLVPDASADERFADLPMVRHNPNVRFYAGVPLRVGDDATKVGTLCLIDPTPQSLSAEQVDLLVDLGRWAERELATGVEIDRTRKIIAALHPGPVTAAGYTIAPREPGPMGRMVDCQLQGTTLRFTLVDVPSDSPAAPLLAASVRAFLSATALDVAAAVAAAQEHFGEQLAAAGTVAAIVHGTLDTATGRVEYVDAGYGTVRHVHQNTTRLLSSATLPVGLRSPARPHRTIVLAEGDLVLIGNPPRTDRSSDAVSSASDAHLTITRTAGSGVVPMERTIAETAPGNA